MANWLDVVPSPSAASIAAGILALLIAGAGCSEDATGGGAGGGDGGAPGDGGAAGDGGAGGAGAVAPSAAVSGTTGGLVDTLPIEPAEVLERFTGDFVATSGDEGVQLRGCVVDAPELGEHVLYVARGALAAGETDREMVLVLEPFIEPNYIEDEVRGWFFVPPEGGPWTCDEVAAVLAAEPPEAIDCAMTFLRLEGEDAIQGYRYAASPPYDSCFAEPGAFTWVTWALLADAITWGEQDHGDAGNEGEPTEVIFERVGEAG